MPGWPSCTKGTLFLGGSLGVHPSLQGVLASHLHGIRPSQSVSSREHGGASTAGPRPPRKPDPGSLPRVSPRNGVPAFLEVVLERADRKTDGRSGPRRAARRAGAAKGLLSLPFGCRKDSFPSLVTPRWAQAEQLQTRRVQQSHLWGAGRTTGRRRVPGPPSLRRGRGTSQGLSRGS